MNYLKIAWRNLVKKKGFTLIYILGLAVGIGAVMLDGLWVHDELSFNKNFNNYDRIAQVMHHDTFNGERTTYPWNPYHLGQLIEKGYGSQFKYVVMSSSPNQNILKYGEAKIRVNGAYMDRDAPAMLSLQMVYGVQDGLKEVYSVMLSESVARTFFGDQNPVNKILHFANTADVKVTGVYRDFPSNSEFKDLSFITPWSLLLALAPGIKGGDPWMNNNYFTYVQIGDNTEMEKVSGSIRDLKSRNLDKVKAGLLKSVLFLHPMSKWHLYAEFKGDTNTGGRIEYVWLFSIVGLFMLFLACVNFVNLSTANAQSRAKEIGIRKTIGSTRKQLIRQFLSETLLIVTFSLLLALVLILVAVPFFNQLSDKQLSVPWANISFWIFNLVFCLLLTVAAGFYPSFYFSSFHPVKVLKGTIRVGRAALLRRKSLVVIQFTVSIILIICTIVVVQQIGYAKDRQMGYQAKDLIAIPKSMGKDFSAFRNELKATGMVLEVTESANPITENYISDSRFNWEGKNPNISLDIPISNVTPEYGKTIGWKIREGRDFSRDFLTDSSAFIVNEAAIKFMALKNPLGKTIEWNGKPFHIIGVVNDIVVESPYQPVQPYIYQSTGDQAYITTLRLNSRAGIPKALSAVGKIFSRFNPEIPFDYSFIDREYAKKFGDEERIGKLASLLALLAIFISSLGIFGLAILMADQRIREIGIRKILGSSILNIWNLLTGDFIKLIFISMLIASPLAYYFMHNWLQGYAYRTGMPWTIFVFTGLGILVITLITISYQTIKAALTNPVKVIRNE